MRIVEVASVKTKGAEVIVRGRINEDSRLPLELVVKLWMLSDEALWRLSYLKGKRIDSLLLSMPTDFPVDV